MDQEDLNQCVWVRDRKRYGKWNEKKTRSQDSSWNWIDFCTRGRILNLWKIVPSISLKCLYYHFPSIVVTTLATSKWIWKYLNYSVKFVFFFLNLIITCRYLYKKLSFSSRPSSTFTVPTLRKKTRRKKHRHILFVAFIISI